jgi:hypothetical protein
LVGQAKKAGLRRGWTAKGHIAFLFVADRATIAVACAFRWRVCVDAPNGWGLACTVFFEDAASSHELGHPSPACSVTFTWKPPFAPDASSFQDRCDQRDLLVEYQSHGCRTQSIDPHYWIRES